MVAWSNSSLTNIRQEEVWEIESGTHSQMYHILIIVDLDVMIKQV